MLEVSQSVKQCEAASMRPSNKYVAPEQLEPSAHADVLYQLNELGSEGWQVIIRTGQLR